MSKSARKFKFPKSKSIVVLLVFLHCLLWLAWFALISSSSLSTKSSSSSCKRFTKCSLLNCINVATTVIYQECSNENLLHFPLSLELLLNVYFAEQRMMHHHEDYFKTKNDSKRLFVLRIVTIFAPKSIISNIALLRTQFLKVLNSIWGNLGSPRGHTFTLPRPSYPHLQSSFGLGEVWLG